MLSHIQKNKIVSLLQLLNSYTGVNVQQPTFLINRNEFLRNLKTGSIKE